MQYTPVIVKCLSAYNLFGMAGAGLGGLIAWIDILGPPTGYHDDALGHMSAYIIGGYFFPITMAYSSYRYCFKSKPESR